MIILEFYLPRPSLIRWLRYGTNPKATIIPQLPGSCYLANYGITSFHLIILEDIERHWQPVIWENRSITEYIDTFQKHFVCCTDF